MAQKNRCGFSLEGLSNQGPSNTKASKSFKIGSEGLLTIGRSLRSGVTRAVFPEDLKVSERRIFDPQDKSLLFWNKLLMLSCIFAVSVDPLFLYLPVFQAEKMCLHIHSSLAYATTTLRTVIDVFYFARILLQFRTAYIAPSSRVFGRGELVIDPKEIANRYICRYFFVDLFSVLPLPQVCMYNSLLFFDHSLSIASFETFSSTGCGVEVLTWSRRFRRIGYKTGAGDHRIRSIHS